MEFNGHHLTYCSNIHPGEQWHQVFENLRTHIPAIRKQLEWEGAFGIGLRLSHEASIALEEPENLLVFQDWLIAENAYVFTMNGFPYGDFHRTVVKDQVHAPDWTTQERKAYTRRLVKILATLIPTGGEGGISTSPISYRHWFTDEQATKQAFETASRNLLDLVGLMATIEQETQKFIHLDIEPEPDGLIENSGELIRFFEKFLLPKASLLAERLAVSIDHAVHLIRRHVQVCYDVCHFAIMYEEPDETFAKFEKAGIGIGKIQLSAALRIDLTGDRRVIKRNLEPFAESTYLHQVVGQLGSGELVSYSDLPDALRSIEQATEEEWRVHFHVPLFVEGYGDFFSTQDFLKKTLDYLTRNPLISRHLEVETYTWEVLPSVMQQEMATSISRELQWVVDHLPYEEKPRTEN